MTRALTLADLDAELTSHRAALAAFVATVEALDEAAWHAHPEPGKWSPAQVAEHLRLTYLVVLAELEGTGGFRVRTRWWQQRLFRFLYLRRILDRGVFPRGVPAVREIRPGEGPFERAAAVAGLRAEGERFLRAVVAAAGRPGVTVTHPFLGQVEVLPGLRFATQHIRHHHGQVLPRLP
jgi:hypothetical protein